MNKSGILVQYLMLQIIKRRLQNLLRIHLHDFMYVLRGSERKDQRKCS